MYVNMYVFYFYIFLHKCVYLNIYNYIVEIEYNNYLVG